MIIDRYIVYILHFFKKGERDIRQKKEIQEHSHYLNNIDIHILYTFLRYIYIKTHTHLFTCNSIVKVLLIVNKFEIIIYIQQY